MAARPPSLASAYSEAAVAATPSSLFLAFPTYSTPFPSAYSTPSTSYTTPTDLVEYAPLYITVVFHAVITFLSTMLNGWLTAFFVATGIISNLFSIYIFVHCERSKMSAIQYYLVTLLIWQTSLLANAFLLYSLPLLIFDNVTEQGNYVYIYPYVYMFANTTHTGSVWVVLTLTIDRYLALCQPLKHRALGKRSRVRRLMVVVSIVAIIFALPRYFEVLVVQEVRDDNTTVPAIVRSDLFDNRPYWSVYHVILPTLFVTLCPCLLLFGLTVRISFALRAAIAKRKSLCQPALEVDSRNRKDVASSRKEHKSNIMLVLVIAKFLMSDILPTIIDVLEHFVGSNDFTTSKLASLLVDLSNFLLVLNCSSNFWVFLIWGKRFRQSCRRLLLSYRAGLALYKVFAGSEPDLVSMCAPSSFTTAYRTTTLNWADRNDTARKQHRPGQSFNDARYNHARNNHSSSSGKTKGGGGAADIDRVDLLAQLERQCLLTTRSDGSHSLDAQFPFTQHTNVV